MQQQTEVTLAEATRTWARIAAHSFGGPAAQIAVMHRVVVEEKRWIGEERFLHALNYCMLLPGPEAHQLVTWLGWLLHGTRGGVIAGALFVLPGFLSILALSILYVHVRDVTAVSGLLYGLKAAVLALVIEAVVRIGKRVLKNDTMRAVAIVSFIGLFFFGLPFPAMILGAGLLGLLGHRLAPDRFSVIRLHQPATGSTPTLLDAWLDEHSPPLPDPAVTLRTASTWLALWLGPTLLLLAMLGPDDTFVQVATLFSRAAVVTFGGAYAVLAYVAQQAVEAQGWLTPAEMLDGLGMAETTPGPLIQVVQFVGFLATWRDPGGLPPMVAAVLGSVLTAWVTFVPSWLFIFTGAPYIEWLRGQHRLTAALSTITAAVVGAVLNLALWLAIHVCFHVVGTWEGPLRLRVPLPDPGTADPGALLIATGATLAVLRWHAPIHRVVIGGALAGLVWRVVAG